MSLAHINWLVWNFCTRNDLISVFHQTLIDLAKGRAAPDYNEGLQQYVLQPYLNTETEETLEVKPQDKYCDRRGKKILPNLGFELQVTQGQVGPHSVLYLQYLHFTLSSMIDQYVSYQVKVCTTCLLLSSGKKFSPRKIVRQNASSCKQFGVKFTSLVFFSSCCLTTVKGFMCSSCITDMSGGSSRYSTSKIPSF